MTLTAIDTDDELLAVVDYGKIWAPGLPFDESDPLDWQDKQQVLHLYPFEVTLPSIPTSARRSDDTSIRRRRWDLTLTPYRRTSDSVSPRRRPPAHPNRT